jgi:hypothetical protein
MDNADDENPVRPDNMQNQIASRGRTPQMRVAEFSGDREPQRDVYKSGTELLNACNLKFSVG